MPKKQFTIDCDRPRELELTWKSFWKDFTVYLDGTPIGVLNPKELRTGGTYSLPGNSTLNVQLKQSLFAAELQVLQDGQPLPGSATDPVQRVKQTSTIIFVIGGFNLLLGAAGLFMEAELMSLFSAGWDTAVFGIFFLILGWLVKRYQSQPALITAIIMYLADSLLEMAAIISGGGRPSIASIIVRVLFLAGMAQGVGALNAIKSTARRLETGN